MRFSLIYDTIQSIVVTFDVTLSVLIYFLADAKSFFALLLKRKGINQLLDGRSTRDKYWGSSYLQ